MMSIDEIEYKVGQGQMTAAQCFTAMKRRIQELECFVKLLPTSPCGDPDEAVLGELSSQMRNIPVPASLNKQDDAPKALRKGREMPIREWLKTLPNGYRERALANLDNKDLTASELGDALLGAFVWEHSPEGIGYWHELWKCIFDHNEIPTNEQ